MSDDANSFGTLDSLQNRYHVLRHGRSEGNELNVIVSEPDRGLGGFGLTELGKTQVQETCKRHRAELNDVTRIFASDFLRTQQTAGIVAQHLSLEVEFTPSLRERFFGKWEGAGCEHYHDVWRQDALAPDKSVDDVESVAAVASRMTGLVRKIEQRLSAEGESGQHILLVSHGDPLQVLLTAICGRDLHQHRAMAVLQTAELRPLAQSACSP
ncbi:MAG: histidine phosphatase family protein [Rubripirellula sp.]